MTLAAFLIGSDAFSFRSISRMGLEHWAAPGKPLGKKPTHFIRLHPWTRSPSQYLIHSIVFIFPSFSALLAHHSANTAESFKLTADLALSPESKKVREESEMIAKEKLKMGYYIKP